MKKQKLWNWVMIGIPMVAILLACAANGVTVFYPEKSETLYYSYLDLVPDCSTALSLPLAVVLAGVVLAVGIYNLISGKEVLKVMYIFSLLSCCAAVMPILFRTEGAVILPNTLVPILMGAQGLICYHFSLKGLPVKTKEAPRLKPKRK